MTLALELAARAEAEGEVPVGAILVMDDRIIGRGWNRPIASHDPTAHAEIVALRDAGSKERNYRLPHATLYVTLEPCPMCAGAIIHARLKRVVFAAPDPRSGAAGSVFDLLSSDDHRFNHAVAVDGGCLAPLSADKIRAFFKSKRHQKPNDEAAS
jgi:tRNA(adenine34) deaminase